MTSRYCLSITGIDTLQLEAYNWSLVFNLVPQSHLRRQRVSSHVFISQLPELTSVDSWMSQTLVYWVLGQFASDVATNARTGGVFRSWETVGQAISYGINAKASNKFIPFGIYIGLFAVAMPLFWLVLMELPVESRVPRIVDNEGRVVGDLAKVQAALPDERVARQIAE